jgi:hypothetical protein
MPPLAFDDEMLDRVMAAAALLPVNARDNFLRSVANRVSDLPYQAGMPEIERAISFVLGCRGVGGGVTTFDRIKQDKVVARARAERQFRTGASR